MHCHRTALCYTLSPHCPIHTHCHTHTLSRCVCVRALPLCCTHLPLRAPYGVGPPYAPLCVPTVRPSVCAHTLQVAMLLYTVIGGGIYFDEFSKFSWTQWLFFPLGLLGCVGGVLVLSKVRPLESP